MKTKLLYYTDCFIFGGCENVLLNLIGSKDVNDMFDVYLAYASNRNYRIGVNGKLGWFTKKYPLRLLNNDTLFYRIDLSGINRYAGYLIKLPFFMLQMIGVYAAYNYVRLYFFFKKVKPDILHINNGGYPGAPSCLVAVFSAKSAGIKRIVFTVNNLARPQKCLIEKKADKYIQKHVDFFVTASALARMKLMTNRHFSPDRIVQIFNALGNETVLKGRGELLAEYGISADKFVLSTVALLTERKGQMHLLNAIRDLRERNANISDNIILFLVGEGEDRAKIELFLKKHSLESNVFVTGFRNDYYDFISASDLFILPSTKDEDMPLVVLSAMSLGKTIVSTKVAGIVEEIRDGIDGVLLEPSELGRLSYVIEMLYNDRTLRDRYAKSAKQRYQECFALDKIIAQYITIYNKTLEKVDDL
jgi:glycosyltransferase involved in cell wall biosynthesis